LSFFQAGAMLHCLLDFPSQRAPFLENFLREISVARNRSFFRDFKFLSSVSTSESKTGSFYGSPLRMNSPIDVGVSDSLITDLPRRFR
jgi:hypothetical protein